MMYSPTPPSFSALVVHPGLGDCFLFLFSKCIYLLGCLRSFFFFFLTVQVFFFTPFRPCIHREWVAIIQVPFHWSSQSVLLWVEQAGTSAEPKSLSLWLPSFSDHFPSHILGSYLGS